MHLIETTAFFRDIWEDSSETYLDNATILSDVWNVSKSSIVMSEFTTWHASFTDFFIKLRRYTITRKRLLFAKKRNRFRLVVIGLYQDGACTNLFENLHVKSLKGLSYEIDFENVDENWQILALTRAAVGF